MHQILSKFRFLTRKKPSRFTAGLLEDYDLQNYAASLLKQGEIVGVYNRGVNALWVNSENSLVAEKIASIKGSERQKKALALTVGFEVIKQMIDLDRLNEDAKNFLEINEDLKSILGSLCFLRLPIKKSYIGTLPEVVVSQDDAGDHWIQVWDPHGNVHTENLINLAHALGVRFPAVTSMNISGTPEIIDQKEAELFCQQKGIKCYLKDPNSHPDLVGSYTILTLSEKGIELTRDGNIPGKIIEFIVGKPFITAQTKPSNYPQIIFPESLTEGLTSKGMRMAILFYLEGKNPEEINQLLSKEYKL